MRTRTRTILTGLVLAAALVGGVAWATIPGTDGTIQGCYTTSNGNLRVVEGAADCRNSETAISWNKQGQTGAAGVDGRNGQDGAPGAKGEPGAAGTNGTNGQDGAPGAKGDPCHATDPACVGPRGEDGTDGTDGAAGPAGQQGPPGPGGGAPASLDTLDGIACNAAGTPGTVAVAYGPPPGRAVTLSCTATASRTLTVATTGSGAGTVASDVGGIVCPSTCSQDFVPGTVVTLTASSPTDAFTGWSGACSGSGPCAVTMDAAKSVSANFVPGVVLTVSQDGGVIGYECHGFAGCSARDGTRVRLSSDPGGLSCDYVRSTYGPRQDGTCAYRFPAGTRITLTATTLTAPPALVNWGGLCGLAGAAVGATCTVTLLGDATVTAGYYFPA